MRLTKNIYRSFLTIGNHRCYPLEQISRLECFLSLNKKYFIKKIKKYNSSREQHIMDDMGLYTQKQITNIPVIPLIEVIPAGEYNYHVYPYLKANDLTIEKFDYNDFYKVFDIVKYLHQRKIVHLDIKPDNFLKKGR